MATSPVVLSPPETSTSSLGSPPPKVDPNKIDALQAIARDRNAAGLTLTSQPTLAWLLGGRVHVSLAAAPIVAVNIDTQGTAEAAVSVFVTHNEAERLAREELPPALNVFSVAWHENVITAAQRTGYLLEADPRSELDAALQQLRIQLTDRELGLYESLCQDAARIMTAALRESTPAETELHLAQRLAAATLEHGAEPLVTLVGGHSRRSYRHPLPTVQPLGHRAMAVLCARRHGLIANVTRWVQFEPLTTTQLQQESAIARVEREFLDASIPGNPLSAAFAKGKAAYGKYGFDQREWERHHQGGIAGFAGRDPRATDITNILVPQRCALAWNPSAPDVKIEDTILRDGAALRVLTYDPEWPSHDVMGLARPLPLVLA